MNQAFTIPNSENYSTIFGELVSGKGLTSAQCIGQCTGCTCSCKCSCKSACDFDIEWEGGI